jgi:hypothetical protein
MSNRVGARSRWQRPFDFLYLPWCLPASGRPNLWSGAQPSAWRSCSSCQGKRVATRELLALIYDCFTEGFGTAGFQESKALLDALA